MIIEVKIGEFSETIEIPQAFRPDMDNIASRIEQFAASSNADISALDLRGLLPQMIRGIAGCEHGCPADAKGLIARGYAGFHLNYIEGGILTAKSAIANGKTIHIKMFPDF